MSNIEQMDISHFLAHLIERHPGDGLTVSGFAEKCGFHGSTARHWKKGTRPSQATLVLIRQYIEKFYKNDTDILEAMESYYQSNKMEVDALDNHSLSEYGTYIDEYGDEILVESMSHVPFYCQVFVLDHTKIFDDKTYYVMFVEDTINKKYLGFLYRDNDDDMIRVIDLDITPSISYELARECIKQLSYQCLSAYSEYGTLKGNTLIEARRKYIQAYGEELLQEERDEETYYQELIADLEGETL